MLKNIGGDGRIGSGKKMQVYMNEYGRSTHNMSRIWRSSIAPGMGVPCFKDVGLNGDTWEIDIRTMFRTLPTIGPLFGAFKVQVDLFQCPIRLYNAQLHNNALEIGRNMEKVIFPKIRIKGPKPNLDNEDINQSQISSSALMAYLGLRGLGNNNDNTKETISRDVNAIMQIAYWDIFKNYYANKQEDNAYVVNNRIIDVIKFGWINTTDASISTTKSSLIIEDNKNIKQYIGLSNSDNNISNEITITIGSCFMTNDITNIERYSEDAVTISLINQETRTSFTTTLKNLMEEAGPYTKSPFSDSDFKNIYGCEYKFVVPAKYIDDDGYITLIPINKCRSSSEINTTFNTPINIIDISSQDIYARTTTTDNILEEFQLTNIDEMRELILQQPKSSPLIICDENNNNFLPYSAVNKVYGIRYDEKREYKYTSQIGNCGLFVKTYQSDRFNNWLNTEWIEGNNGINEITAIDTSEGSFTMDTLILQKKIYNMLNRIAMSGGSYNDWQEAVYGENYVGKAESPVYVGGYSADISFDEVISNSSTEDEPLGTLGGRGSADNHKGGTIRIKCSEPCIIMGILSLTPRVDYSQGNSWIYKLETMNDLHKPALDGIGFQDLPTDEMCAWDTIIDDDGNVEYKSAGKQTAFIEWQTAVNECYGNFADINKEMYMTLNRRYEVDYDENGNMTIGDLTTYIDPSKFNYAFAQTDINAQNFWAHIGFDVKTRRIMSAKQMPNL